ncbi:hypothetical protein Bpfe_003631 [Biomphalaria pfeifferi]|uniref:CUB domain-containing protein n=1 Tax=Biomphalaria pfeifferi TaxID=112525 RepID=A0AAD8C5L4_BIOPF|nr:hypothetical protein Bpfe_003631 [Biomphalaria pfeifferi]
MYVTLKLLVAILSFFKYLDTISIQCEIGEEGKNASIFIEWNQNNSEKDFLVLYKVNNSEKEVVHCDLAGLCGTLSNRFGSISANFQSNYTVKVTFNNVSRLHEGEWKVKLQSLTKMTLNDYCHFEIFARPKYDNCTYEFDQAENLPKVTCSAVRIYPKLKCVLYLSTESNNSLVVTRLSYIHLSDNRYPPYFTSDCIFYFNNSMSKKEQTIIINMYPDLRSQEKAAIFGRNISVFFFRDYEYDIERNTSTNYSTGK